MKFSKQPFSLFFSQKTKKQSNIWNQTTNLELPLFHLLQWVIPYSNNFMRKIISVLRGTFFLANTNLTKDKIFKIYSWLTAIPICARKVCAHYICILLNNCITSLKRLLSALNMYKSTLWINYVQVNNFVISVKQSACMF